MDALLSRPHPHSLNNEDLSSCLVLIGVVGADLLVDFGSYQILHVDAFLESNQCGLDGEVEVVAAVDSSEFGKGERLSQLPDF